MWYILATIIISLVIFVSLKDRRKLNLPPGPLPLPVLGNLLSIDPVNPHLSLSKLARRYSGICGLRMGSVYTVLLTDPKLIRQAFAKDSFTGRAPLYLTHGIMQGYGIVCAEGDHWKEQRKFVSSTLKSLGMMKHGGKREKLEERITHSISELLTRLKDTDTVLGVDPLESLHHCLGNLINDLVFGQTYGEDDETWKWLRHLQEDGVKHIGIAGPLNFLPFLRHLPRYKNLMKFLIDGKLKTHQVYKKIIESDQEGKESFVSIFAEVMRKRSSNNEDLGSFTDQQFYHLLADLYGAGVDTTLTTIRWSLLFLAAHPEDQEKIHEEMVESLGEREVVLEDRGRLVYLEASICEAQRIRSVVPLGIPHGTTEDTTLGDFDIPKGTMVVPFQWAIHMDETYFEDPEVFRPTRFISDDELKRPEAFLPFLTGKRMCVGDELARWILFLFVGRIIQRFRVSLPPGEKVDLIGDCGITLVPKPHKLIFSER
ncbi:cytochrome P450 306a1 [Fopius arisanus]|uniref:Cytochrome P450 306a1 n=1 Tax=Fopius arisanus TaxID=64838 RepID=A0A0C9RAE0_9HYME|nr:PREDICTED: cytochrome P450 306a1 [Fopius arisanus]